MRCGSETWNCRWGCRHPWPSWPASEILRHPLLQDLHEPRFEEHIDVLDIQADDAVERRVPWEHLAQGVYLDVIHRENHIRPIEHALVHAHPRIFLGSR